MSSGQLTTQELSGLRMMSHQYLFYPLRVPNDDRLIGILLAEHRKPGGVHWARFKTLMKHRSREFTLALLAVMQATEVDPDTDGQHNDGRQLASAGVAS